MRIFQIQILIGCTFYNNKCALSKKYTRGQQIKKKEFNNKRINIRIYLSKFTKVIIHKIFQLYICFSFFDVEYISRIFSINFCTT